MSTDMEFYDEIPDEIRGSRNHAVAQELRKHPGQWAKWPYPQTPRQAYSLTDNIKRGIYPALPGSEFETRTVGGHTWLRYRPAGK